MSNKYLFHSLEFVKTDEIAVYSILNGESLIVNIGSEGLEVAFPHEQRVHKMSWKELEENGS
jgi:hypothetical protein